MKLEDLAKAIWLPVATVLLTLIEFAEACLPSLSKAELKVQPIQVEPDFYR